MSRRSPSSSSTASPGPRQQAAPSCSPSSSPPSSAPSSAASLLGTDPGGGTFRPLLPAPCLLLVSVSSPERPPLFSSWLPLASASLPSRMLIRLLSSPWHVHLIASPLSVVRWASLRGVSWAVSTLPGVWACFSGLPVLLLCRLTRTRAGGACLCSGAPSALSPVVAPSLAGGRGDEAITTRERPVSTYS